MTKPPKPPEPEVIGPCTAIRRFDPTVTVTELKDEMTADERWEFAREAIKELDGMELEERKTER